MNASFMDAHWASARGSKEGSSEAGGMMHVVPVKLLTHMKIYRFVMRGRPDDELYGGSKKKGPTGAPPWSDALLVLGVYDLE